TVHSAHAAKNHDRKLGASGAAQVLFAGQEFARFEGQVLEAKVLDAIAKNLGANEQVTHTGLLAPIRPIASELGSFSASVGVECTRVHGSENHLPLLLWLSTQPPRCMKRAADSNTATIVLTTTPKEKR